ncbi:helix-turn-helix domain-containing protein [Streptomyces albogriseolus]
MSAWHQARETWATVDDLDIEFVVQERIPDHGLTRASRRIAARQLTERDATVDEVAELLGVDPRTVYRWRREDRQAGRQAA